MDIKKIGLEEIILLSESLPQELKESLSEQGINLRRVEGSGPLDSRILESANRENPSLVVAHLSREKRKLFRDGAARNLIKNTLFPLLLIHENGKGTLSSTRGLFDSVILATNWSDSAYKTLLYVIGLKELLGVLDIVYVLNEKPTIKDIRQLKERVEEVRKICLEEQIDAESHIYAGKTAGEIVLASKDYDATLIAMGYQSKDIFKEIFSGSACYQVAEGSSVPVLIIP
ncbi:MAG: universal stress protein [Proteobacteria bacterium]|nr:universal stress protein [Pseudomonadota bacterium]